jgi:hypothetical protein
MEITMTTQEILRSQVMVQVPEDVLDQASAADRLELSVRQVKRLKRRMRSEGVAGLSVKNVASHRTATHRQRCWRKRSS